MNILIIGCGKVGLTLAEQLSQEKHAVTLVDQDQERLNNAVNTFDVQGIQGNGTSCTVLTEAGVEGADLVLAVTDHDEINMLACLMARKMGHCQTIARVRDPEYSKDIRLIQEELGLAMVINPEQAAARNINHLIQLPSALDVDTFDKGKVNMVRLQIAEGSPLDGKNLIEVNSMLSGRMLVCIRERNGEIVIPNGSTELRAGDRISVVIPMSEIASVLHKLKLQRRTIRSVMIAGGGATSVYLTGMLLDSGVTVKIIESDYDRCKLLADLLPKAIIIHGDCSDRQLLMEEGLQSAEAFVSLTDIDEENIMLGLYASKVSDAKVVTKVGHIELDEVIDSLPIGSVIRPKDITAEIIVRYVRAMENASGNNVETLYRLLDGSVEALEFVVHAGKHGLIDVPLSKLQLKKGILICSINRGGRIITPSGQDAMQEGDIVIIVTTQKGITDLHDIMRY